MSQKTVLTTAAPGAIIVGFVASALWFAPDATLLGQAARGYPYVGLIGALLLAARLKRTRLFAATVVLTLMQLFLLPTVLGANPLAQALSATFLPCGFALLALRNDASFNVAGVVKSVALVCAPLGAAAFFSAGNLPGAQQLLTAVFIDPIYTDWSALSQPALFMLAAALAIAVIAALRSQRATEAGLAWLMLAAALALAAAPASTDRSIWLLAGALVLVVALVETAFALAFHDELTGLPDRRALAQLTASLEAPYAIAIVDVDHFKSFNDTHGHDVGDQVLCMVAARLGAVGGGGRAYRTGGEEFTIVFAGIGKQEAVTHVDVMREAIAGASFTLRGEGRPTGKRAVAQRGRGASGQQLNVTVSVGIASPSARATSVADVTRAADKAMYKAKNEGRNRVIAR